MEDRKAIVLYPSPSMGHLISMVELGKLIVKDHSSSFSITILVYTPPFNTGSIDSYISAVSAAVPSISFHHLPTISPPSSDYNKCFEDLAFDLPRLLNPHVGQALDTISSSQSSTRLIKAFIIDFFNDAVFDVAKCLKIPIYYFYTTSASTLASFLYLPTIHQIATKSIKDEDVVLHVPGLPPFHASCLPTALHDRNSKAYKGFINCSINMSKSSGIIVNAVESLETRPLRALRDGLCVQNGTTPPIFCIGPLIDDDHGSEHECLSWLNSQPSQSVVFLSFGSMGLFSAKQLMEIANGLEKSGHRFLWVVRSPPGVGNNSNDNIEKRRSILAPPEPNLDELLPKGFLERTKDKGLVVKSWAPQVAVLSHDSVGGFVTHCGWNSVLEAVCAGVPMIAWPLYAEQRLLRVFVVEEMKVALAVKEESESESESESGGGGFVSAAELEERVRELMDSDRGREVRERVLKMTDGALAAVRDGGSSHVALTELTESWIQN